MAVAALGIGLAACSAPAAPTASGHVTLNVVGFEGESTEVADIPTLNAAFEKKYPNITLNYKYVANTEYDQYNNTRLASGTAADVLMTNPTRVREWAKQGYLADLSSQPWVGNILPNIAPFGQLGGKTYAFSQQNIPIGMYANLDILNAAGITSVPQTWPEFKAALQKLKAAGQPGLLLANQGGWTSEQLQLALAANLVPNDWGPGYDSGASTWNPTWSPVVDRIKDLLDSGLVDGKLMNGVEPFNIGNGQFASGKWAFTIMGAWQLQSFQQNAKFKFSLNPVPGGDAGTKPKSFTFVGSGWGVNAASPVKTAAEEYVAFMAEPASDTGYLTAENSFSTLSNVPSPTMSSATAFVDAFNASRTTPSPVEFIQFADSEAKMQNEGSSLFNDPKQSDATLLGMLDTQIPKTK